MVDGELRLVRIIPTSSMGMSLFSASIETRTRRSVVSMSIVLLVRLRKRALSSAYAESEILPAGRSHCLCTVS